MSRSSPSAEPKPTASLMPQRGVFKTALNSPKRELQEPRDHFAIELRNAMYESGKSAYRLADDSGVDVGNLHRTLNGERPNITRETILRLALGLRLSKQQVEDVVEAINRLYDAAGLKTI